MIKMSKMKVKVIESPSIYPVTLDEVKQHLRITYDFEDAYLEGLIEVATEGVQDYLGRYLITHKLLGSLDILSTNEAWWSGTRQGSITELSGYSNTIELRWLPLISVESITTYARNDTPAVFPSTNYRVDTSDPDLWGRIRLVQGAVWPSDLRNLNGVEIQYFVGYGTTADDVPRILKQGLLMVIAYLYNNRGSCCAEACQEGQGGGTFLTPYRVRKV